MKPPQKPTPLNKARSLTTGRGTKSIANSLPSMRSLMTQLRKDKKPK
jgi:hypothetical protein